MSASGEVRYDLIVRGGALVIPGVGRVRADVGIAGGRIVALAEALPGEAAEVYDATGKTVLPGLFDPHTHIGNERSYDEEAETETRAAVLGGVTTIGIFLRSLDDSYTKHLPAFRRAMDTVSYVDSVFHPQIFTDEQIAEIPRYAAEYGIRSFKFYMSGLPGIVKSVSDDVLLRGFRAVAGLGPDAVACVHCETGALIELARRELQTKPEGTLADWELAHPAEAEALAIQTALHLAGTAGAHLYVVHLSSRQGLDVVRRGRRQGLRFTVETTTPYLGIASDDPNGFLAKAVPPVRTRDHHDALWQGVLEGSINTVGTDNTSRCRATKQPEAGLHGARPGLPVLGTHLPVLLHHGRERGVPLEVLVDCATRAPAKVYGIYPQKGTIAVGSDADLAIVDLDLERVVRADELLGMSDFSPFEGKRLRGWPVATIKGGRIVARDGRIVGPPTGRYLPREARDRAPEVDWLRRPG
ncbi:MAG: amidohydrolase family protein [Rhodoplanes sp.]|uniref:dihydroorotase n=1 Tax=Rhodoplanes sp. TaxID=1968906 RepID=UPI00184A16E8|nr:amidohydrolase family protein [Rhodoplanes sp.]NVO13529.1 amidohydrolase family protein [Rhodoplanes sp.]